MPIWLQAGFWGLVAGGALVVGAAIAWFVEVPRAGVASMVAFGAGVQISALWPSSWSTRRSHGVGSLRRWSAFSPAPWCTSRRMSSWPGTAPATASGLVTSSRRGATSRATVPRSPSAPCSMGSPSRSVLVAIFISNLHEGLSSAAGMKRNGRGAGYVFGVGVGIAVASGLAGLLGCLLLQGASPALIAVITAIAAGAILAMLADAMIPEAFERTHAYAGLITTTGFMVSFSVERFG